jgi:hypothetical protein
LLLDECEEDAMLQRLNSFFSVRRRDEAEAAIKNDTSHEVARPSVTLPLDTFGTIMVQFKALGLIEKSERKRSVSDSGTYWTLTAYGDSHLTSLRAISRGPEPPVVETKESESGDAAQHASRKDGIAESAEDDERSVAS